MFVWWLACTLLLMLAVLSIETTLVMFGSKVGIHYLSLQYWVVLVASIVGLITICSMLASQFYVSRLGWSIDLPLSQDGFVDAVMLSQALLISTALVFCFFTRGLRLGN